MAPYRSFKGRSKNQSRGEGRSSLQSKHPKKSRRRTQVSFERPTKVLEDTQESETSNVGEDVPESVITDENGSSEDDESEPDGSPVYASLLQSLSNISGHDEPREKKRKLNSHRADQPVTHEVIFSESDQEPDDHSESETESQDGLVEFNDGKDPFSLHFSDETQDGFLNLIENITANEWRTEKSIGNSSCSAQIKVPMLSDASAHVLPSMSPDSFYLKERLKLTGTEILSAIEEPLRVACHPILNYRDVLFPLRSLENIDSIRKIVCLHSLNHIFKTRDQVIKHTARLARVNEGNEEEFRDQGFTRPKVLILLPTRQSCVRYVEAIIEICQPEQQENKKRFQESFHSGRDNFVENKPADFRELFSGNDDDMFRLGLKFTRKTIKFFAKFYNSDIIFASPLGLKMALGTDSKKEDYDFISSIEIVIMDQAEAISMQNWEHVEHIFERLNLQPKESHGCDFSRIRNWYLDGHAKFLRQTILLSAYNFPALNKLYTQHMQNVAGKLKYTRHEKGAILDVHISVTHTFSRFDCQDPSAEPEARFQYFSATVLPSLIKHIRQCGTNTHGGVVVFVPGYADFVRLRNYLAVANEAQDFSFGLISEYTPLKDVSRARSYFMSGKNAMLLYTERAHHFRRYHLRGVRKIIMYGLPENPIFYKEAVDGFLGDTLASGKADGLVEGMKVKSLFCRFDVMKLERIVGSSRCAAMMKEKGGDTFDFV